ncbi:hypothetical protein PAMP_000697 [Pampus punctatissimus]
MTAITYSSAAQRPLKEIQVLEHPSAPENVPELMSEIREPHNMQEENPIRREKEGLKNEGGAEGGKLQRKRQTGGTGVTKKKMNRGGKKQLRNRIIGKDLKGSWGKWVEAKEREREDEIKQREKWMEKDKSWSPFLWKFPLKNSTEAGWKKEKNIMKGMRHHLIFLWLPLLLLSLCPKPASSQGNFPRMENIAAFKPVSTSPARSTCGVPERSSYCQSASSQTELLACYQAFCVQECPYRSSTPPYAPLLLLAHRGTCVTEDTNDTRPGIQTEHETRTTFGSEGVSSGSSGVMFQPVQQGCLVSPPSQNLGALGSLTLALWIKPSSSEEMMLLEKSSEERLVFSVTVSEQVVTLRYGQSSSQALLSVTFTTEGRLALERWTHLVLQFTCGELEYTVCEYQQPVSQKYLEVKIIIVPLLTVNIKTAFLLVNTDLHLILTDFQVHDKRVSLFLNGLEEDGTPFDTKPLTTRLYDISEDGAMWVGLSSNGSNQFIGRMQDFRFYPATLTNREIVEVYSGVLPQLHSQSECRCPPSHPRVHPLVERYCIPNAVEDTTNDRVLRLNLNAHPLSYINDQDMGTTWLSKIMTTQELDKGVTITVDFANGQYQVFYIIVQFGGLLPESVVIQRRKLTLTDPENGTTTEQPWLDWQYIAKDCSGLPIVSNEYNSEDTVLIACQKPTNINKHGHTHAYTGKVPLQHYLKANDAPYTGGNITVSLLTPEPNLRPGYNDFYNTPELQKMVHATQVRIHLSGQYHTRAAGVNQRHNYYAINEVTISGRCECHGHADHCDTSVTPYRCLCLPETHTEGNNCQHCAPLYNDKPFRQGDQLQPMSCRPCQCHGHAHSCHYDAQADDQPDEHYRGGGGVCDNCMHNTTGKNCELCISGFFRPEDSDPTSVYACQLCNCHTAGTVNGSTDCAQIGGQCQCKAAVTGRRCADCLPGWYGLRASNPQGCIRCNCSDIGVISTSTVGVPSCNEDTGQCRCKPHVTDGCIPCDCDPLGSLSPFCEPVGGQCECKPGVGGQRCDSCGSGLNMWKAITVTRVVMVTTPWSIETPWAVCHVCVTSVALCQTVYVICGPDSAHAEKGWRERSVPTVPKTTITAVQTSTRCCPRAAYHVSVTPEEQWQGQSVTALQGSVFVYQLAMERTAVAVDPVRVCVWSVTAIPWELHNAVVKARADSVHVSILRWEGDAVTSVVRCFLDSTLASAAPSQQPAPVGFALSYSSINLSWRPPDSPNSNRLNYTLIRDGQSVHSIQSDFPFSPKSFEDTDLSPYTNYSYWLITANVAGVTISASASYQTLGAPPEADQLHLNLVGRPGPTSASFNWSTLRNDTGPVERFVLSSTESSSGAKPVIHYTGPSTEAVASGLKPFTQYTVILEACSSGGCTSTLPLSILTASAPPQNQPPPRVTSTGPHALHASWEPPSQPNGIITKYEVFLRGPMESQNFSSPAVEKRVFFSIGWLDPSVSTEARLTNTSTVSPPESSASVAGLQAFSTYQMRVVSINVAGSVTSGWTTARTMEGVSPLSSTSLRVTWSSTEGDGVIARGQVTEYRVNLLTEQTSNAYAPPVVSQVLHSFGPSSQPVYLVKGLKPYHMYNFTVTLCTKTGCITSLPSSGQTLPAAPTGLSPPRLHPVNETTIHIDWDPPAQLNGPHPLYQVERTDVSLSDPQGPIVRGTRFPGNSYYHFPSDTLPINSDFTGNQEEFLAIQIKNGRPYFLFDPQGSAVAVSVQDDGGRRYNDGQWHSIIATRRGAVGTIVVNNRYRGSASSSGSSTIIGDNTGVFIGGLPENLTLLREDSGDARLMRQGFSGCLRDVSFKMTDGPSEEWKSLDWAKATKKIAVYEVWEGCPSQTADGAHFLGHGYLELSRHVFSGGEDFDISMDFRTDQLNALLLFTYNTQTEDYMLVELEAGILSFILACEGHVTELSMWVGLSYCDGDWKQLSLAKRDYVISAAVNDWAEETRVVGGAGRLRVDTPLYMGGVPIELMHPALDSRSHKHGLGGCIRGLTIRSDETIPPVSQSVNLSVASRRSVRVYLDGCPTSESRYNCRGNDSVLVFTGRNTQAKDYSLQPFTVPGFVPPPTSVQSLDGFSAKVSWSPPTGDIRGLIDRYELRAYNRDRAEAQPIKATYLANGNFTGVLSGLTPSTRYIVTVSTCIPLGCTESLHNDNGDDNDLRSSLTTPEEALYVTWEPPARPNGGITEYLLYHNDQTVYRGNDRQHNITGLGVYSTHVLVLSACTSVGCVNSSQVTMLTSQLPPGPLQAPTLTLLDSRTLLVEWSRPSQVNGVLEVYSIFLSHGGLQPVLAYNSSELFEDHTLRNLTPGTAYTITVAACTGGGCTLSPPSQAQTEESTPENVPAPLVTPLSPNALNVSWTPPDTPNGIITSYGLWLDGALILNSSSSQRFFVVKGLSPWSRHVLRLQACTTRGCGKGPMVEMHTLEMAPEGPILLKLTNHSSRSVRARWTAPPRPNGNLSYTLYYKSKAPDGLSPPRLAHVTSTSLNVSWSAPAHSNAPGPLHYTLQMRTLPQRPVIRLLENATDIFTYYVEGLSPYTQYLFRVVVTHTHGQTAGPWATLRTAEDSPGAVDTPAVSGLHPRSVTVTWVPPLQPNGIITNYTVYLHPIFALDSKPNSGSSPSMTLNSSLGPNPNPTPSTEGGYLHYLRPTSNLTTLSSSHISISTPRAHTNNPFSSSRPGISEDNQIKSSHVNNTSQGSGSSSFQHIEPSTISGANPSPSLLEYNSSSLNTDHFIKQDPLHKPNQISNSYSAELGSSPLSATVPGNTTSYTFLDLLPYQTYTLKVQYVVLALWWVVERRVAGTKQVSIVGHLPPDPPPLSFLDSSSALSPWTSYQYRLVVHNQAGSTTGPWVNITTRPSRPAGLSPPRVNVLGPESLRVTWFPPFIPNGEIHGYEIRLPEPRIFHNSGNASEHNVTITNLIPYTNYSITVLACSKGGGVVGGCTESLPTLTITLPASPQGLAPLSVVAVSESFLAISWQPPSRPNGPNIRYELLRHKTYQPLAITTVPTVTATSPPPSEDHHRWLHVYSGTKLFYQDKGLSRFTRYQYQLVVHNDVGYSSGEIVTAMTMGGIPFQPPSLMAYAVNHTAVQVNWTQPSLHDLQGEVESYFLTIDSARSSQNMVFRPEIISTMITDLWPSTTYLVSLQVSNGAHNTTKAIVNVTTEDGEPDGMSAPEVVPVNSSTARVLWFPPQQPNGAITSYHVYVNDHLHGSVDNSSGSYLLRDLLPFTVYNVQVEVCTVYSCVRSNVTQTTTVEDVPADLVTPHAQVVGPRPSGIMLGYEVLRRTLRSCVSGSTGVTSSVGEESGGAGGVRFTCSYLQCPATHGVCGTSCFHPDIQVCCNGLLYMKEPHHHCCERSYLSFSNSSNPVCCNGKLLPPHPDHQCCGGYYVHVKTNEYCCPDHSQGRVSVGLGDSCCGGVPYSTKGGQLCCSGSLHDGYGVQCCGGRVVDDTLVCCGDAERGEVHTYTQGFVCCGPDYIKSSTSLCCVGSDGFPIMHPAGNATVTLQCCGSKVIRQEEECCSGIGYDPQRHVCANRPTPGLSIQHQCMQGAVCPVAAASTAYCGSCDLDPSMTACTWVLTADTHPDTQSTYSSSINTTHETPTTGFYIHTNRSANTYKTTNTYSHTHTGSLGYKGSLCPSHEEIVYSGDANRYTYTDSDLEPFTTYEYRVRGWNSFGRGSSDVTTVTTSEAKPWGVAPPRWSRLSERDDIIQLHWQAPARPNGAITHYVILRDGQERYRGDENSFTDVGGIRPFQEYSYQLQVCNRAGCTDSTQGAPEGVQPPVVTALSSSSLNVSWSKPTHPSGIVQWYHLNQTGLGTIFTHTEGPRNYTVTGLQPYTDYSFLLVACTAFRCGASLPSTGRTLQASPAGVWSSPRHLIINTSVVELYWDQPSQPNGHISQYRLNRDGHTIFTGDHRDQNYTDTGLLPNHRYVYELEATTGGGTGLSDKYVIKTPVSCPTGIPAPYNVTVSGPHSISLAWTPPVQFNSSQPVNYNILLNPGSDSAIMHHAGQGMHLSVTGLESFTTYNIRVQACQIEGCGVGVGVYVRTLETTPEGLLPPTVKAAGASVLEIHWSPPQKPNGLITSYHIYSFFQYRVRAHNSKGSVLSQWTLAQTLQAEPQDMSPPIVTPTGAYSVHLKWSGPRQPNGFISHYRLVYKKHQQDPTLNSTAVTALTVEGSVLEATVYGLEPYSEYTLQVEAVNEAAPPASQPPPKPIFIGPDHVSLTWGPPTQPNGPIGEYFLLGRSLEEMGRGRSNEEDSVREKVLFQETSPQQTHTYSYTVTGLRPWTQYEFSIRTHNIAGHTRSPWVTVTTRQAPPRGLASPTVSHLQGRPSEVLVSWSPPLEPNGVLQSYRIQRNSVSFSFSFDPTVLSYTDEDLLPFSTYSYTIIACTSEGCITSPYTNITTLEAPPATVEAPTVDTITSNSINISWSKPLTQNGEVTEYVLKLNSQEAYRGRNLKTELSDLQPHTSYQLVLLACTSGGCTTSAAMSIVTEEAPPTDLSAPTLKVTGPESVEVSWGPPEHPNGVITGFELRRDGEVIYVGTETHYHDFTLLPSVEYSYFVRANNSRGAVSSAEVTAKTHPSAPSGVGLPILSPLGSSQVKVEWSTPARPNGDIVSYTVYQRDPVQLNMMTTVYTPDDSAFSERHTTLQGLAPYHSQFCNERKYGEEYEIRIRVKMGGECHLLVTENIVVDNPAQRRDSNHRYEVRVEACTALGCSSSDWSSILTLEAPPAGQTAPLLDLQPDTHTNLQTTFLITWSPPAQPNGRILHYEVYRRLDHTTDTQRSYAATPVCRNVSTTCKDEGLLPYTVYQYQSLYWKDLLMVTATRPLRILQWEIGVRGQGGEGIYKTVQVTEHVQYNMLILRQPFCTKQCTSSNRVLMTERWASDQQLWAVNSAGRSASPWTSGRTGPAPPEGIDPPNFLRVSATSAVVEIHPPARPNGIVSLYRVFSLDHNNHTLLSEGTSHHITLHGLRPYTQYWVGVEACTCYQCCSQGPLSELQTLAAPPAHQPPPRPVTLTSRSVQLEWDEPFAPNGVIESCELHLRSPCPQPPQPVTLPCVEGPIEICFFGNRRGYNVTGLQPYSTYELRAACFNNMGSTVSNWTTVTTLSEAPHYVSPFSVDSNLTIIWLDWVGSFSLNGYLKEYSVTESELRVYTGFYSYLHIPRTSQKTLSFQVTCTTDSGSASTPTIRYSPATGLDPPGPEDSGKQGVSMSATPVYSELWFILLLTLLGLFLLAILLGLVLQRALRKNPSARERPPLVMLQKTRKAGRDMYMFDTVADCVEISNVILKSYTVYTEGLADTKIVGSSSRFSPISVLRVPSQPDLSQAFSQQSLHRSVSQLIDRKSLMMEEGSWDNPLGHDSGLYVEEDEFIDTIKALSSVKKEHTMFTDTHL